MTYYFLLWARSTSFCNLYWYLLFDLSKYSCHSLIIYLQAFSFSLIHHWLWKLYIYVQLLSPDSLLHHPEFPSASWCPDTRRHPHHQHFWALTDHSWMTQKNCKQLVLELGRLFISTSRSNCEMRRNMQKKSRATSQTPQTLPNRECLMLAFITARSEKVWFIWKGCHKKDSSI